MSPNVRSSIRPATRPGMPSRNGSTFLDPATLMRIKNLQLRARVVVEGFLSGLHRSPYHGFSVEFTEYRQYTPGDDPRYLDWRLYARSDRYYLKRFEDETNLRCWLLVDGSRSMSYGSVAYTKAEYSRTVAATIAYFLALQRDAVGLITFDESVRDYVPSRYRPGHLHRLMMSLDSAPAGTSTDLAAPLEQVARLARKRGLVILISDLLGTVETVETRLGYLRSQGHEVVVIRVLDAAELDFPFKEAALFEDLETGRKLYVDPEVMRADYAVRFGEHRAQIARACSRLGIDLFQLTTREPLERALFDLLSARMRRGRPMARHAGMARRAPGSGGG